MEHRTDLGDRSDVAAVLALIPVAGLTLVDVGCGAGKNSRELAEAGATVLAVEPDPIQAAKNRDAAAPPGVTFIEAGAESLPAESHSADGVLFFRSLHHVPVEAMEASLSEAARVLKPDTGFLCVIEPGMTGAHFPVMRPFHDETRVREAAQSALDRIERLFGARNSFLYLQLLRYADFDALVARVLGQTFNAIERERVDTDEVRALFEGGRTAPRRLCVRAAHAARPLPNAAERLIFSIRFLQSFFGASADCGPVGSEPRRPGVDPNPRP